MKKICSGFFGTLANKTRVSILTYLREGPKSVNDIVTATGYEQSLVSHNLRLLRECHFVDVSVKGKQRIYTLNQDTIQPLFVLVDKHMQMHCPDNKACTGCTK